MSHDTEKSDRERAENVLTHIGNVMHYDQTIGAISYDRKELQFQLEKYFLVWLTEVFGANHF